MHKLDIPGEAAKQGNPRPDQDRDAGDRHFVNQPGFKEPLDGFPTVDIDMARSRSRQTPNQISGRAPPKFRPRRSPAWRE